MTHSKHTFRLGTFIALLLFPLSRNNLWIWHFHPLELALRNSNRHPTSLIVANFIICTYVYGIYIPVSTLKHLCVCVVLSASNFLFNTFNFCFGPSKHVQFAFVFPFSSFFAFCISTPLIAALTYLWPFTEIFHAYAEYFYRSAAKNIACRFLNFISCFFLLFFFFAFPVSFA